jgi:hypothetical protein
MDEVESFFNPQHMIWIDDVKFRLTVRGEKRKTGRKLLVISTASLSEEDRQMLTEEYLRYFKDGWISFPLKERASHLMTRIDRRVFNFGRFLVNWIPRFRRKAYTIPRSRALEVMLKISSHEEEKLQSYLANILKNRRRTIGKFRMDGSQFSKGTLSDNRPFSGGHNCSSWIATAPIGSQGQPLLEILGGDRNLEIGTNPGWWTNWLAATAPADRVPFVIHWTPLSLEEAKDSIVSGASFSWDFWRH